MKKITSIFLFLILGVMIFFFLNSIYSEIDKEYHAGKDRSYQAYIENINTPEKKWLNGHLGIFFRFKYFGNINWLVIPLAIFFLFSIKRQKRWLKALGFVYVVSVLLLAIRGFFWWRYQFTLFPFTIAIIMYLGWEVLKNKEFLIKTGFFLFAICLVFFNVYHYFDSYKFLWTNKASILNKKFPTQALNYINDIKQDISDSKFLVCSSPHIFFYYSNKNAIYFYNPVYQDKFWRLDRKPLFQFLRNEINVKYIFSDWIFEQEERHLSIAEILDLDCNKILSNRGYQLYLLRDKLLEEELKSKTFSEYKVWDSTAVRPEIAFPQYQIQGVRGKFNFEYKKIEGKNILTVNNEEEGKSGERIIQFGYTLDDKVAKVYSLDSLFVYFFVEVKMPGGIINNENYIFIQDYDGKWERTKTFFTAPRWRKYVVCRKIRPRSKKIVTGFKFQPQSGRDKLQIRDIKIYITDQKL